VPTVWGPRNRPQVLVILALGVASAALVGCGSGGPAGDNNSDSNGSANNGSNSNATQNQAPTVSQVTVDPAVPNVGDVCQLTATATDPEGSTLTYSWTVRTPDGGVSVSGTGNPFMWNAPSDVAGSFTATVTATDPDGAFATKPAIVDVRTGFDVTVDGPVGAGAASTRWMPALVETIAVTVTAKSTGETLGQATVTPAAPTARVLGVARGTECVITAAAQGASGPAVARAAAEVFAPAGAPLAVNLAMLGTGASVTVAAPASTLGAGEVATLTAACMDAGGNAIPVDPGAWRWVATSATGRDVGGFGDATSGSPAWTAPSSGGDYTLTAWAPISENEWVSGSATVTVRSHTVAFSQEPSVSPSAVEPGGTVACAAGAACTEGHPMAYVWTAVGPGGLAAGTFDDPTAAEPTWTAPNMAGTYVLRVTATCSVGAVASSTAEVVVETGWVITVRDRGGMP